jgi:hypothetical protein
MRPARERFAIVVQKLRDRCANFGEGGASLGVNLPQIAWASLDARPAGSLC